MNIEFVGQLVESMNEAVLKLERAIKKKQIDEATKLKTFIFDLHRQINQSLKESDV